MEDSGSISWTTNSTSSPVSSYSVTLRSGDEIEAVITTMSTSFEFTGLMPGRSYTATIFGVSEIGIGFPSMITFFIPTEQDATLSGTYICIYVRTCKCACVLHAYTYVHTYVGAVRILKHIIVSYICTYIPYNRKVWWAECFASLLLSVWQKKFGE